MLITSTVQVSAVLVQCLAAPSSSDLETAETKWKGSHGVGGGPGIYNRGLGLGGWGPYGAWGGGWPGVGRFAGGPYGPGFYDVPRYDDWTAFALRAFPGGPDPWGLGYSEWTLFNCTVKVENPLKNGGDTIRLFLLTDLSKLL